MSCLSTYPKICGHPNLNNYLVGSVYSKAGYVLGHSDRDFESNED